MGNTEPFPWPRGLTGYRAMRKGLLAAVAILLVNQSLALAQGWGPYPYAPYPYSPYQYPAGHAWQPMGRPPMPPTMMRVWAPPGPMIRPPVGPYYPPPQPGVAPPGMAGWPSAQGTGPTLTPPQPAAPPPGGASSAPMQAQAQALPPALPLPSVPEVPPAPLPAPTPVPSTAERPVPPALLNPAPANTMPLPPSTDSCDAGCGDSCSSCPAPCPTCPSPAPCKEKKDLKFPFFKHKLEKPIGFWGSGEYLLWWFKNGHVPPLVTAGGSGVVGDPGTTVLLDNLDFDNDFRQGGRFTIGYQLPFLPFVGLEGDYFFIAQRESQEVALSPGRPVLGRPFLNALTGLPSTALVAEPGLAAGDIAVSSRTGLWGADASLACGLLANDLFHCALLGGFRFINLDDELTITANSTFADIVPVFGGGTRSVVDNFRTVNQFYGGQIGAEVGVQIWRVSLDVRSRVALGDMRQRAYIDGTTRLTSAVGTTTVEPGGLLALPSNAGRYDRHRLAYIPEVGVNLGFQATSHVKLFAGYTFLWISDVVRAGDQIDPTVNVTQVPTAAGPGTLIGPARPAFDFNSTDFWAQAINFGMELRF
jgi:hypothetical protein